MDKMKRWMELSKQLKEIKAEEMVLRRELCGAILEGMALPATLKVEAAGLVVVAKNAVSHTIDEAVLDQIYDKLDTAEKQAMKWKPSVVMKGYKALPPNSLLHDAIVTKPSAPTLKVEEA